MDFVTGYGLIPLAGLLGLAISYIDGKQNNTEKSMSDHAKIAILLAFVAGLAIFFNSGEAMEFFTGGARVVADSAETAARGGGSSIASVVSSTKQVAPSVVSTVSSTVSSIPETFATGLANF